MKDLLYKAKDLKKILMLYSNPNETDKFVFGRVLTIDEDFVSILMASPYGHYDGVLIKPCEDFYRIDEGGSYTERMKRLIDFDIDSIPAQNFTDDGVLRQGLEFARDNNKIVSCELLHSGYDDVCGFIEAFDDDICTVKLVDADGNDDGTAHFGISDVTQLSIDSEDEQRILKLWQDLR